jgi:hypothetical protein
MNIRSSRRRNHIGIPVSGIAIASLLILSSINTAYAFYTWVDEKGQLHVTDYPKPQKPVPDESAGPDQEKKITEPAMQESAAKPGQPTTVGEKAVVQSVLTGTVASALKGEQKTTPPPPMQGKLTTAPQPTVAPTTQPTVSAVQARPATPQAVPVQRGMQGLEQSPFAAIVLLILLVLGYLYFSLCLFLIARKLNVAGAWMAWVPILQVFTFISCAHKPVWWFLLLLVPIVNFFITIYLWMSIAENLGREKWFALLMLVPVVNLIYMGVLAFSKQQTAS